MCPLPRAQRHSPAAPSICARPSPSPAPCRLLHPWRKWRLYCRRQPPSSRRPRGSIPPSRASRMNASSVGYLKRASGLFQFLVHDPLRLVTDDWRSAARQSTLQELARRRTRVQVTGVTRPIARRPAGCWLRLSPDNNVDFVVVDPAQLPRHSSVAATLDHRCNHPSSGAPQLQLELRLTQLTKPRVAPTARPGVLPVLMPLAPGAGA